MPINEPSASLPLSDVLRAANGLVAAKLIDDWALGGALAAIYYVEPFTTKTKLEDILQRHKLKLPNL